MKYVLALDQGTTSSRAILFDHDGAPVATAQREFERRLQSLARHLLPVGRIALLQPARRFPGRRHRVGLAQLKTVSRRIGPFVAQLGKHGDCPIHRIVGARRRSCGRSRARSRWR